MPNSLLTIDMITRKALQIFENELVLTRNVNRQYDDSFAQRGAKIGSSLRIRLPDRAVVTDGAALQVQDDNEQFTTLNVTSRKHIGISFTSDEMTLSLDDFSDRVLKPRISQLASSVDADVALRAYQNIYNTVGTPGTTPSTSLVLLQAQQKLNEGAVPGRRFATVNPAANAGLVEGMKGFFNPNGTISRQFRSGMMGEGVLGYEEIQMSQSIPQHTTGSRDASASTTVTTTVSTQGTKTIQLSQGAVTTTIKKGDVFNITGVFTVNPQTRQTTGSLQDFVADADSTAVAGVWTVTVSPPIYTASEALATVDSFPQAGAAVTFRGAANTSYAQNLVYNPDAIAFVTADLVLPQGVDMASRQTHNGISMRIVRQYDINNDRMPCRIDVLYGSDVIRPAAAVRMWGA